MTGEHEDGQGVTAAATGEARAAYGAWTTRASRHEAGPAPRAGHAQAAPGRAGGSETGDLGMATAEYAVGTLAAVGFAGLLFAVLRSGEVQGLLLELVRRALGSV